MKKRQQTSVYYEFINYNNKVRTRCFTVHLVTNRPHLHSDIEMFWCVRGSCNLRIEGVEYGMEAGDVVAIDSGIIHEIYNGSPDVIQMVFSLSSDLIREMRSYRVSLNTCVGEVEKEDIRRLRRGMHRLHTYIGQRGSGVRGEKDDEMSLPWQYETYSCIYEILSVLSKYAEKQPESEKSAENESIFSRCIEFMMKNYDRQISPDDVATHLGISSATLYRLLKRYINMNFTQCLNSIRISAAEAQLMNSDADIVNIANDCGFSSLSNFYRVFGEFNELPPSEYRRRRGVSERHMNDTAFMGNDYGRADSSELNWTAAVEL